FSLGRATANSRWRSSGGIAEIGCAGMACLFISRFLSFTSPASFSLAILVFPASFGRAFVQFFQESQQSQPFFFRKDGGHIFHRGGVHAKPSICIIVFAKKLSGRFSPQCLGSLS